MGSGPSSLLAGATTENDFSGKLGDTRQRDPGPGSSLTWKESGVPATCTPGSRLTQCGSLVPMSHLRSLRIHRGQAHTVLCSTRDTPRPTGSASPSCTGQGVLMGLLLLCSQASEDRQGLASTARLSRRPGPHVGLGTV